MREYDKMISGKFYDSSEKELVEKRKKAKEFADVFNSTASFDYETRKKLIEGFFGHVGSNCCIEKSIRLDYGCNISVGDNFYANADCKFLDVCKITIGDNCMIGTSVILATPTHPLLPEQRNARIDKNGRQYVLELGKPITIGSSVWIASGAIICGGVTIGDNAVIGAGSVVTKDIPSNVFACGVPCKVMREISESDRIKE